MLILCKQQSLSLFILQVNTVQCVDFGCREMVYYYSDYHDDKHALASMLGKQISVQLYDFLLFSLPLKTKMNVLSCQPLITRRLGHGFGLCSFIFSLKQHKGVLSLSIYLILFTNPLEELLSIQTVGVKLKTQVEGRFSIVIKSSECESQKEHKARFKGLLWYLFIGLYFPMFFCRKPDLHGASITRGPRVIQKLPPCICDSCSTFAQDKQSLYFTQID